MLRATTSWNKFNNKSRFQNGTCLRTEVFLYFIPKRSGKSNWGVNLGWVQQQYSIKGFGMDQPLTGSSGTRAAPAIRMRNSAILLNVNIPVRFWDED